MQSGLLSSWGAGRKFVRLRRLYQAKMMLGEVSYSTPKRPLDSAQCWVWQNLRDSIGWATEIGRDHSYKFFRQQDTIWKGTLSFHGRHKNRVAHPYFQNRRSLSQWLRQISCESQAGYLSSHTVQAEPQISQNDFPIPQSVQFSLPVISDSLWPHEPQHARPPCPAPTPRVHPNPCPSSQ